MRQLGSAQESQVWDWGSLNVNGPLSSQRMGVEGLLCASPCNHPGDGEEGLFVSPLPCNHPEREVMVRNVLKPSLENSWPFRPLALLVSKSPGFRGLFMLGLRSSRHGHDLGSGPSPSLWPSLEDRPPSQLPPHLGHLGALSDLFSHGFQGSALPGSSLTLASGICSALVEHSPTNPLWDKASAPISPAVRRLLNEAGQRVVWA